MIEVFNRKQAWDVANAIFPTDYRKNERGSQNAGYPVFESTAEGVEDWISDLGTSLELNLQGGKKTVRIHIIPVTSNHEFRVKYAVGNHDMIFDTNDIAAVYETVVGLGEQTNFPIDKGVIMEALVKMRYGKTLKYRHGNISIELLK